MNELYAALLRRAAQADLDGRPQDRAVMMDAAAYVLDSRPATEMPEAPADAKTHYVDKEPLI